LRNSFSVTVNSLQNSIVTAQGSKLIFNIHNCCQTFKITIQGNFFHKSLKVSTKRPFKRFKKTIFPLGNAQSLLLNKTHHTIFFYFMINISYIMHRQILMGKLYVSNFCLDKRFMEEGKTRLSAYKNCDLVFYKKSRFSFNL